LEQLYQAHEGTEIRKLLLLKEEADNVLQLIDGKTLHSYVQSALETENSSSSSSASEMHNNEDTDVTAMYNKVTRMLADDILVLKRIDRIHNTSTTSSTSTNSPSKSKKIEVNIKVFLHSGEYMYIRYTYQ
jgi:CRISPR/Cas system-associated exonuclease Cas4 (RecB family)